MLIWPDLGNPVPKRYAERYEPLSWPERHLLSLDSIQSDTSCTDLERLLSTRRTERELGLISDAALGAWLSLGCRAQLVEGSVYGFDISFRPAPSAGAIHPIHLVLATPGGSTWSRYDAVNHALIGFSSSLEASKVHLAMQEILPAADATLVLFAAEAGKTAAKYDHSASLVWRDSGALLAVLGLAAHALGLGFCPLGATGEPWVSRLLEQRGLFGVGAAFVGTRAAPG